MCPQGREHRKQEIKYEKWRLLLYQVIDMPYSIDLNRPYGSSERHLQMDEDDEIFNHVDLHMYILGCGDGGGSKKIHDDSSCKKDSMDDSILIEVKTVFSLNLTLLVDEEIEVIEMMTL
nr:hypothetical protein [Tanacetum cinerariifolium]